MELALAGSGAERLGADAGAFRRDGFGRGRAAVGSP